MTMVARDLSFETDIIQKEAIFCQSLISVYTCPLISHGSEGFCHTRRWLKGPLPCITKGQICVELSSGSACALLSVHSLDIGRINKMNTCVKQIITLNFKGGEPLKSVNQDK